jgi:DNA-binding transcriptional LysR family regulator
MHVDARRLAVLLAVHRSGGILAAADELRLSASAVSQQVARLEAETGACWPPRPTGLRQS